MSNKKNDQIATNCRIPYIIRNRVFRHFISLFIISNVFLSGSAIAQQFVPFNASSLIKQGDEVRYGVYTIRKIGDGIYQMNNRAVHPPVGTPGALGVDNYLICGKTKALMIDLGNNYMDGNNQVPKRINGAEELRSIVSVLAGPVPVEIAVTHMHSDHNGMSGAFVNRNVKFWAGDGEDLSMLKTQLNLDTTLYQHFNQGQKSFDLGGGLIFETFLIKGHTNGGTVYILKKDGMLFTGDCFGNGEGIGMGTGEKVRSFAECTQKLEDYILANFSPYERYLLRVYSGHSWENGYRGIYKESTIPVDVGYLDWRFIQNMASCANGIVKGKWLDEGSGLRFIEYSTDPKSSNYNANVRPGERRGVMIYGIGSMGGFLKVAYDAAGLKMQE